ncbi:MAG: NrfD/PsrC family molybdoenzyme membrane anchor subunit [Desulfobulbaceae bacterium]|nr:NrfD/PsrC family molybdoenzyme membrane anchor subunit [Desulfobulbaceae bacterium]
MYREHLPHTDPGPLENFDSDEKFPVPARDPDADITYYGMPAVKHSHYHWKTALSFFAEALGGGPQIIATLISRFGDRKDCHLVRGGRYLALAGSFLSPALLISELHMPRRWFNMLRIFRPTSAMSIGNMSLTLFGVFSGLTAIGQILEDLGRKKAGQLLGRIFSVPAAAAGGMICLYPGTELEETCTPLWADSHPLLSPLFAATGLSTGAAALTIVSGYMDVSDQGRDRLNTFAALALGVQLGGAVLVDRSWRCKAGAQSYPGSRYSFLFRFGVIGLGIVLPLALRLPQAVTGKKMPGNALAASTATLAGSYLLYETVLEAGNDSAEEPQVYLEHTRPGKKEQGRGAAVAGLRKAILSLLTAAGMAYFLLNRRKTGEY